MEGQEIERLTRHNYQYFIQSIEDLCKQAALEEGVYFVGVVAYYNRHTGDSDFQTRSWGDKYALAQVLNIASQDIVADPEGDSDCAK